LKNQLKFFYEIKEEDDEDNKILEILLLINWKDVAIHTLQMMLKDNFNMNEVQIL
jgi:hypothetical protein